MPGSGPLARGSQNPPIQARLRQPWDSPRSPTSAHMALLFLPPRRRSRSSTEWPPWPSTRWTAPRSSARSPCQEAAEEIQRLPTTTVMDCPSSALRGSTSIRSSTSIALRRRVPTASAPNKIAATMRRGILVHALTACCGRARRRIIPPVSRAPRSSTSRPTGTPRRSTPTSASHGCTGARTARCCSASITRRARGTRTRSWLTRTAIFGRISWFPRISRALTA